MRNQIADLTKNRWADRIDCSIIWSKENQSSQRAFAQMDESSQLPFPYWIRTSRSLARGWISDISAIKRQHFSPTIPYSNYDSHHKY